MSKQKDVEIEVEVRAETAKALLVYNGKVEVWVPKSQITDETEREGNKMTIFMTEWQATEKGLL